MKNSLEKFENLNMVTISITYGFCQNIRTEIPDEAIFPLTKQKKGEITFSILLTKIETQHITL